MATSKMELATKDPQIGTAMASGHTLVRRFTDEQDGKTTLERATKAAQEEQDAIWEQEQKDRLSTYFESPDSNKRQASCTVLIHS